ncbi:hypothetical protein ABH931_007032 [Streptacidiphilus sp. MAP12-33]|uniref:DUF4232 domain-containing protein n=1 Tax=Streptacidiphilus sp. MAP12-33 TaxID=3156266 RepID=UPI003519A808
MAAARTLKCTAALFAVSCLSLTSCTGGGSPTAGGTAHGPVASASAPLPSGGAGSPVGTPSESTSTSTSTSVSDSVSASSSATSAGGGTGGGTPQCGDDDIRTSWGESTNGDPKQYSAVLFKNVSHHTCTLRGYPGETIVVGGTVINATRELNGDFGFTSRQTGPPLVTLVPGGFAHAETGWSLRTGDRTCYPTGSGAFEFTVPNTTRTVILSYGHIGAMGICSGLEISPVRPGVYG